jgi:hypothetical protein
MESSQSGYIPTSGQKVPGDSVVDHPILKRANQIIQGERREQYGPVESSFQIVARMWNAYTGSDLTSIDVAMMMILYKASREAYAHKDDNLVDIAGYAALAFDVSQP